MTLLARTPRHPCGDGSVINLSTSGQPPAKIRLRLRGQRRRKRTFSIRVLPLQHGLITSARIMQPALSLSHRVPRPRITHTRRPGTLNGLTSTHTSATAAKRPIPLVIPPTNRPPRDLPAGKDIPVFFQQSQRLRTRLGLLINRFRRQPPIRSSGEP